jgi:hypothetical protein
MEWCGGFASRAAAIVAGTRKDVPGNRRLAVKGEIGEGEVPGGGGGGGELGTYYGKA